LINFYALRTAKGLIVEMKILKRVLSFMVISILLLHSINNIAYASPETPTREPIKAAVFLSNMNNLLISTAKKSLEDIQKEDENKIEFTFFDAKANQVIQNENIEKTINKGFDLFVVNLVSSNVDEIKDSLAKVMKANIPLIFYLPRTPQSLVNIVSSYGKAIIINGDLEQSGTLEGNILAYVWNANKDTLDKNKDNIIQYVMLKGPVNNESANARTKYSIRALSEAGIKTQQLLSTVCNWEKECGRTTIESALLTLDGKIEAIISNNDEMAIGAIEALQKNGFNKGGDSTYIPVVGVGGLPNSKELIDQGIMTGTAVEDIRTETNAIYTIGMNLVSGNEPLHGTNFKFDETGITIKIPYYAYTK
jgi:methyl-galactoside transport system substrate-binding protein